MGRVAQIPTIGPHPLIPVHTGIQIAKPRLAELAPRCQLEAHSRLMIWIPVCTGMSGGGVVLDRAILMVFVCFCVGWWSILSEVRIPKPLGFNPLRVAAARRSTSAQARLRRWGRNAFVSVREVRGQSKLPKV